MQTTPPTPTVVNLTPKKMVAAIKDLPPLTIMDYVDKHFKGQLIRVSGTVSDLSDFGAPYVTAILKDNDGVDVSANFTKPLAPEAELISKGEKIGVVGQVFNVSALGVVLDECKLGEIKEAKDQSAMTVAVSGDKQWWTTWWGVLILGIVSGLVVWLISRRL
ncbi:MAG TPA: hypothetical protein VNE63_11690 [Candidatus Acidoferrales bacterium]|nr:hypothetical protein [Candidatus Acidoferrales bacterium]